MNKSMVALGCNWRKGYSFIRDWNKISEVDKSLFPSPVDIGNLAELAALEGSDDAHNIFHPERRTDIPL